jgi:DNA helicase-2/ATP-dependent DNA helicase PcrA
MLDLARELNERQLEAASHVAGPLLVIAGAGSGKTRVITHRAAHLALAHGVAPSRILAVTFTNKAAREMAGRIERLLGRPGAMWVATFHATCAKLLRFHGERFGVDPRFTIYDDQDQKAMVVRVLRELAIDDKRFPSRAIQHELGRAKRELVGPADYPRGDWYREQVGRIYDLYERRMREAGALDFGDLLYRTVRAMRADPGLAAEIAGRFDHVMVDEFQDTNLVQLELVRLLAAPHRNVCVVGDDDQSIYSWRGADVTNILEFERHFPGARVVTLDRNYRSTANILEAAHGVVSRLRGRREKRLWTSSPGGARIAVISAPDEREEARLVCRAIRDLRAGGVPLSEQAIFYRINAQSRVFEEVLRALDVPHRVVGGMRFYERAEVKDVLAYLRLIQNPADHTAFVRIVNTPARGIGKTSVDRLVASAAARGCSAFDAIVPGGDEIGRAPAARLAAFRELVERWRVEAGEGPAHLARRVLEDTGYATALEQEDNAESDAKLENVRELLGSIDDFVREAETPSLAAFLELVALQTDVDAVRFDGDQVTLMTVHSAKGLEFDAVYVTGLEDGLFPWRPADASMADAEAELDEERRLAYVAMTRARTRLFLTLARSRRLFGSERLEPPSRFLADLPAGVVQDLSPARPRVSLLDAAGGSRRIAAAPGWGAGATGEVSRPAPTGKATVARAPGEVWVDRSVDQQAEGALRPGMAVRHARFGEGLVLAVHAGARLKADVRFPAFGTKTIVADYLEPA